MLDKTLIWVAIITSIPPTLVGILGYLQGRKTHKMVNSRMDELLKSSKAESKAEGVEQGRAENN